MFEMPVKTKKGKKSPPVSGTSCAICDNEVASEEIAKCIECKKTAHSTVKTKLLF